jgi:DNA-binding NarL/FixJ family response regulator
MTVNHKPAVLIVDDDKDILVSYKIWLENEGFKPLTARDSGEALKILEAETVEVVLLDFKLGDEDGLEVAKMLRAVDENLKIIIITAYPAHDTAVEAIKNGLFDYLSKDTPNETVMETVRKAVRDREREILKKGEMIAGKDVMKFTVVCKHSLIKERLDNFSVNYPDFKLMRTFNSLEELRETAQLPAIDVALVCATCCIQEFEDAFMFFDGLYREMPTVKPVIFNEHFSENQKVDLIRIGVKGFFTVDLNGELLDRALSAIRRGEIWVSRRLSHLAIPNGPEYLRNYLAHMNAFELSPRERDILKAMSLGLKNKDIAEKLFISENTVKTHLNKIFKKFGVRNRAHAIRFALDKKMI